VIEKGIPIPPKARCGPKLSPLGKEIRAMQPGDSRFCATDSERETARGTMRLLKWKHAVRIEGDGWRIWRVD
jgi:hypothetical protein